MAITGYNAIKVFSATMAKDRDALGEKVTEWLGSKPGIKVIDTTLTQSSDNEFHCVTITVFYVLGARA